MSRGWSPRAVKEADNPQTCARDTKPHLRIAQAATYTAGVQGSSIAMTTPLLSGRLLAVARPRWKSAISRTMYSPNPRCGLWSVVPVRPDTSDSNRWPSRFGGSNGPSLLTLSRQFDVDQNFRSALLISCSFDASIEQTLLPLVGAFQVSSALVAAGLAIATGSDVKKTLAALENLKGASGRLELAGEKNSAPIFIDYAHTDDALRQLLQTVRSYTENKLVLLFGCGGDRDRGKRALMGEVAGSLADRIILTTDNPRTEDPQNICADIQSGVSQPCG